MAHFYGEVEGKAKTRGTRCGTKSSGMEAHIRSWNKGVEVQCWYDNSNNKNIFRIYKTNGSNSSYDKVLIHEFDERLD